MAEQLSVLIVVEAIQVYSGNKVHKTIYCFSHQRKKGNLETTRRMYMDNLVNFKYYMAPRFVESHISVLIIALRLFAYDIILGRSRKC